MAKYARDQGFDAQEGVSVEADFEAHRSVDGS
jgi:hypothetical protein